MREGRQVGSDHWAGQGIYFRERKDHGAASRTPTAGVSGIAPGGLLPGHHRLAILTVVRMLHRDDNAVAAVHLARIMRPPDQIPASMKHDACDGQSHDAPIHYATNAPVAGAE
jgi:hypothetical protein